MKKIMNIHFLHRLNFCIRILDIHMYKYENLNTHTHKSIHMYNDTNTDNKKRKKIIWRTQCSNHTIDICDMRITIDKKTTQNNFFAFVEKKKKIKESKIIFVCGREKEMGGVENKRFLCFFCMFVCRCYYQQQ